MILRYGNEFECQIDDCGYNDEGLGVSLSFTFKKWKKKKANWVVGWLLPIACGETKANDDLICAVLRKSSVQQQRHEY